MTSPVAASPVALRLFVERWALLQLQSLTRRLNRGKQLPPHLQTGLRGEFEALFHLRRHGYTIVERRWRSPELNGDLDLVAWDAGTLCFIEVKTRTARDMTPAALAIDFAKRGMLRKMAASYLRTLPHRQRDGLLVRFDIVSVYLLGERVECELLRDAIERN